MQQDLEASWDRRDASSFELLTVTGGRSTALRRIARHIRDAVRADDVVLDVGCGVGLLADHLTGINTVGIDFSASLLARARERLPVARASAFALPLRDESIAVLACLFVLDDYDAAGTQHALSVFGRSVRPGGLLIVAGYAPDDDRMGPRRAEVSAMGTDVHLEGEGYYRALLASVGDTRTVRVENVYARASIERAATPMRRHFVLASVTMPSTRRSLPSQDKTSAGEYRPPREAPS
jgi:ubiquinone/menaquinone biosynthesis C-methylase UbiE